MNSHEERFEMSKKLSNQKEKFNLQAAKCEMILLSVKSFFKLSTQSHSHSLFERNANFCWDESKNEAIRAMIFTLLPDKLSFYDDLFSMTLISRAAIKI